MWDTATWVSVSALAVSGLSFFAAAWAAWVTHRTLSHAKRVHEEDRRVSFERERSALLEVINASRSLLDKTRIRIGTLKANFDAAPEPVRKLMQGYTNLFTDYYPRVEGGVRQAGMLWDEVANWSEDTGIHGLVRHQAKFRALLHEDQVAHDQSVFLVGVFEHELAKAVKRIAESGR
jgi:hypothetical protein